MFEVEAFVAGDDGRQRRKTDHKAEDEAGDVLEVQPPALSGGTSIMCSFCLAAGAYGRYSALQKLLDQQAPGISAQMRESQRGVFSRVLLLRSV